MSKILRFLFLGEAVLCALVGLVLSFKELGTYSMSWIILGVLLYKVAQDEEIEDNGD